MAQRLCSDCVHDPPTVLDDPRAKTCSKVCRDRRSRRQLRERKERNVKIGQGHVPPEVAAVAEVVQTKSRDAAHEVLKEELRPLLRERITGNVLQQLDRLVSLTPAALSKLEEDLGSDDEQIRQRAYTLILRYTLGNPSAAPPPAEQAPAPMTVNFHLPRPGSPEPQEPEPVDAEAMEYRACQDCGQSKPETEFVAGAERCNTCLQEFKTDVAQRFG